MGMIKCLSFELFLSFFAYSWPEEAGLSRDCQDSAAEPGRNEETRQRCRDDDTRLWTKWLDRWQCCRFLFLFQFIPRFILFFSFQLLSVNFRWSYTLELGICTWPCCLNFLNRLAVRIRTMDSTRWGRDPAFGTQPLPPTTKRTRNLDSMNGKTRKLIRCGTAFKKKTTFLLALFFPCLKKLLLMLLFFPPFSFFVNCCFRRKLHFTQFLFPVCFFFLLLWFGTVPRN